MYRKVINLKDNWLLYKLYLQTLLNVKDHQNKYGDENMLTILENQIDDKIKIKKIYQKKK